MIGRVIIRAIGPRVSGSRLARTALIVSVLGMPGRVPVLSQQFYKPDADGTIVTYRCGRIQTKVESTVESVKVGYALFPGDDELAASMTFLIPEGRTARLLGTRVTVQPSGPEGEIHFISQPGWVNSRGRLFPEEPMVGKTREFSFPKFQEHPLYWAWARVPVAPPRTVAVTFPAFLIDDRALEPGQPDGSLRSPRAFHSVSRI